jgi:GT2 family glycosyltransferase
MKLSVVVGTLNRREQLQACLESIFQQTSTPVRVYVTDAGSTDGTVEYLQTIASDRVMPIFEGRRLGQARAYNDVFRGVTTPYVCWLSDDNRVVNSGLDVGVRILDRRPEIGMVALKVRDVRGPFAEAPYIGGISSVGILNVNQGMLRTDIIQRLGGFSERFRDYGIDPDLTARVLFSGYRIAYTKLVAIHHYRNWSADPTSEEYARQMERQAVYLREYNAKYRHLGGPAHAPERFTQTAKTVLRRWFGTRISLNSARPVLGLLPRDWYNVLMGRYISVLDPLRCWGQEHHLVQYCPRHRRPAKLPEDLVDDSTAPAAR